MLRALEDALATFPADRIVVFVHPEDQRAYREDEISRRLARHPHHLAPTAP
jgi:hypothetical protein